MSYSNRYDNFVVTATDQSDWTNLVSFESTREAAEYTAMQWGKNESIEDIKISEVLADVQMEQQFKMVKEPAICNRGCRFSFS